MPETPQPKKPTCDDQSEPSLKSRVVKSAVWVFAGKVVGRGLTLIRLLVLARLLTPEDFGLFGIVLLAIATVQTFTKTGFSAALIQRQENTEDYLDTAWTIQVIRGVLLAGILFAVAPLVAWFFEESRAELLLKVMGISVAFGGLSNIGIIFFRKELKFHKQVLFAGSTAVIELIVGVTVAVKLRSVWALVWARLAGTFARLILSYLLHGYRPSLQLKRSRAHSLFNFGKWVLASSVMLFFLRHGDDAIVGKVLGIGALGVYQLAYRISNAPATEICHTISTVTFPAYSQLQSDLARLKRAYLRTFTIIVGIAMPMAAGIIVVSPTFVHVVLGEKWMGAVVPIQILAAFGLLRAIAATTGPVFHAIGNPRVLTYATLLECLVMFICIGPLIYVGGVIGVCIAVTFAVLSVQLYSTYKLCNITGLKWRLWLTRIIGFGIPTSVMMLCVSFFLQYHSANYLSLITSVVLGFAIYATIVLRLARWNTPPKIIVFATRSSESLISEIRHALFILLRHNPENSANH
jgi:O-antigen/teichoic acid export membrane protein